MTYWQLPNGINVSISLPQILRLKTNRIMGITEKDSHKLCDIISISNMMKLNYVKTSSMEVKLYSVHQTVLTIACVNCIFCVKKVFNEHFCCKPACGRPIPGRHNPYALLLRPKRSSKNLHPRWEFPRLKAGKGKTPYDDTKTLH